MTNKRYTFEAGMSEEFLTDSSGTNFYRCTADGAYNIWRAWERFRKRGIKPLTTAERLDRALNVNHFQEEHFWEGYTCSFPTGQDEIVTFRGKEPVVVVSHNHLPWIDRMPKESKYFLSASRGLNDPVIEYPDATCLRDIVDSALPIREFLSSSENTNKSYFFPINWATKFPENSFESDLDNPNEETKLVVSARLGGVQVLESLIRRVKESKTERKEKDGDGFRKSYIDIGEIRFEQDIFSRAGLLSRQGVSTLRPLSFEIAHLTNIGYADIETTQGFRKVGYTGKFENSRNTFEGIGISPEDANRRQKPRHFSHLDEATTRIQNGGIEYFTKKLVDRKKVDRYLDGLNRLYVSVREVFEISKEEGREEYLTNLIGFLSSVCKSLPARDRELVLSDFVGNYPRFVKEYGSYWSSSSQLKKGEIDFVRGLIEMVEK